MKPARIFQQYIWLVNKLSQYKRLSLEELNNLWLKDEVIGGSPLNRNSFIRHKDAILNMFGIIIECDREHGYKYYIANPEVLKDDAIERWMLSTLTVNTALSDSSSLSDRILLEDVPAGEQYLPDNYPGAQDQPSPGHHLPAFRLRELREDRLALFAQAVSAPMVSADIHGQALCHLFARPHAVCGTLRRDFRTACRLLG